MFAPSVRFSSDTRHEPLAAGRLVCICPAADKLCYDYDLGETWNLACRGLAAIAEISRTPSRGFIRNQDPEQSRQQHRHRLYYFRYSCHNAARPVRLSAARGYALDPRSWWAVSWHNLLFHQKPLGEFAFYGVKHKQSPILIVNVQVFTFIQLIILSSISDARLPWHDPSARVSATAPWSPRPPSTPRADVRTPAPRPPSAPRGPRPPRPPPPWRHVRAAPRLRAIPRSPRPGPAPTRTPAPLGQGAGLLLPWHQWRLRPPHWPRPALALMMNPLMKVMMNSTKVLRKKHFHKLENSLCYNSRIFKLKYNNTTKCLKEP